MSSLNIAICGCGNGAHACAALMSQKGNTVGIYSPLIDEIEQFKKNYDENGGLDAQVGGEKITGLKMNAVSSNPQEILPQASIIFVIVPAYAHRTVFQHIREFMDDSALVVVMPSRGLIEMEVKKHLSGANVMAFQTLPWSCRKVKTGSFVKIMGIKKQIQASSLPGSLSPIFFHVMEALLDMKIQRIRSMLTLTLANMGQIFHPGIMYGLFEDNPNLEFSLEDSPLFYQGVTDKIAGILSGISSEIQIIGRELVDFIPDLEMDKVLTPEKWLMAAYSHVIENPASLRTMLSTNKAYMGIKVPVTAAGEGLYKPDFHSRYVTEDVPYSLLATRSIGQLLDVDTPVMDRVIDSLGSWSGYPYLKRCRETEELSSLCRLPVFYGMNSIEDLIHD